MNMQSKLTIKQRISYWLYFRKLFIKTLFDEKIPMWIAWHIPDKIVMWCCYRVAAKATTGIYGNIAPTDLRFFDMMERWD